MLTPYGKTTKTELAGGLYHVTSRGERREAIYIDEEDREKWLEILELFLWVSWIILVSWIINYFFVCVLDYCNGVRPDPMFFIAVSLRLLMFCIFVLMLSVLVSLSYLLKRGEVQHPLNWFVICFSRPFLFYFC